MADRQAQGRATQNEQQLFRSIIGYLNFSSGQPDTTFQKSLNEVWRLEWPENPWSGLPDRLRRFAESLQSTSSAFADVSQALAVIDLTFNELFPAYRAFHSDLLFHIPPETLQQPFFLARLFESTLSQGPPWDETARVVDGALNQLNDFVGYRPLAVLEDGRKTQPYPHERYRPLPVYIRGAGVAVGPYHDLVEAALDLLEQVPESLLTAAHFDLNRLDELAVDLRAYDHEHPSNKRTNYAFGEWDPHQIDLEGYYRRFVIRKFILDSLEQWVQQYAKQHPREEALFDAAAVLCGTILMASAVSGWGPAAHDSSVTLTSLLPHIAKHRDEFYQWLLQGQRAERRKRLQQEAERTQQPFGHVRQALNLHMAHYGARQIEHAQLARLYAYMGHVEACREEAAAIPCLSSRFQTEILWRISIAHRYLKEGKVARANQLLHEMLDLFHRGVQCGALMDPWNILGFQGNFPLSQSREDVIPDPRVEILLTIVEGIFGVFARALAEAAVQEDHQLESDIAAHFEAFAETWDRYATTAVSDLPKVSGEESLRSAKAVARALSEWKAAGEAAGAISFWRERVAHFDSARSYGQVVFTLLQKNDLVASMGLLVHWLSEAERVGLESGPFSLARLLSEWLDRALKPLVEISRDRADPAESPASAAGADQSVSNTSGPASEAVRRDQRVDGERLSELRPPVLQADTETVRQVWNRVRRMLDYLEANAGTYWRLPSVESILGKQVPKVSSEQDDLDSWDDTDFDGSPSGEEDEGQLGDPLFRAAYDGMVYRDSALDGNLGDVLDEGGPPGETTEIEILGRQLLPRLRFSVTLAKLYSRVGETFLPLLAAGTESDFPLTDEERHDMEAAIEQWVASLQEHERSLHNLLASVWSIAIPEPSGDHDSNVEYDFHVQSKYYLVNVIVGAILACEKALRQLAAALPQELAERFVSARTRPLLELTRAAYAGDVDSVCRLTRDVLKAWSNRSLLYAPLDSGGDPLRMLSVRRLHHNLQFLVTQLCRLGQLKHAWQVVKAAYRMERTNRPSGLAISELDVLLKTAIRATVQSVATSAATWEGDPDRNAVDVLQEIVSHYARLWRQHGAGMRLSAAERLNDDFFFHRVVEFIKSYGSELFDSRMLTLGNLRTVLHHGAGWFLQVLEQKADPLHPNALSEHIRMGKLDKEEAVEIIEAVYETVVDEYDRFLEYNATTTHSDYGNRFYCLLEFLRLEARYRREEWNLVPYEVAHRVLSSSGRLAAARIWERHVATRTRRKSERYLEELADLEETYGMRLPSVRSHLEERLVKRFAFNRILALLPPAVREVERGEVNSQAFCDLRNEINAYLRDTAGAGVEVPEWLQELTKEVKRCIQMHDAQDEFDVGPGDFKPVAISREELQQQLRTWNRPLLPPSSQREP